MKGVAICYIPSDCYLGAIICLQGGLLLHTSSRAAKSAGEVESPLLVDELKRKVFIKCVEDHVSIPTDQLTRAMRFASGAFVF